MFGTRVGDCDDANAAIHPTDTYCQSCFDDTHCVLPGAWCQANECFVGTPCAADADCDDLDLCNGRERCLAFACQGSLPLACGQGETCEPSSGCIPSTEPRCPNGACSPPEEGCISCPQDCGPCGDICPATSVPTRQAFQLVGQDLGLALDDACWADCACAECGNAGFLVGLDGTDVDGLRVTLTPAEMTDATGAFDRAVLDRYLRFATCVNKPLIIAVAPVVPNYHGMYESFPEAWLGGVPYVPFALPEEDVEETRSPVLWDPSFISRYGTLVTELGAAIDGDPRVARVLAGYGIWGELVFDMRPHRADGAPGVDHGVMRAEWLAEGFSQDVWLGAVREISRAFGAAFTSTPTAMQITDVGVRLLHSPAEYATEEAAGFPTLESLLSSAASVALEEGIDELQHDGLSPRQQFGTERPVFATLTSFGQGGIPIHLEAGIYSGIDTVQGCLPSASFFPRTGCSDPEMLACSLFRAERTGASAVTLWGNEWTDPGSLQVIEDWRAGTTPSCQYCEPGAVLDGQSIRVNEIFCPPSDAGVQWRGQGYPGLTWDAGPAAAPSNGYYDRDLSLAAIGSRLKFNLAGCATDHGYANFNQWAGTCGDRLGAYVRCMTDGSCNVQAYVDGQRSIRPCPDADCNVAIAFPAPVTATGNPFEVALESGYLPGTPCIDVVGELPGIDWQSATIRTTQRDGDGRFLALLPQSDAPARFTYRDCNDADRWASYVPACVAGAGNGFCHENAAGDFSLRVVVDAAGAVSAAGFP